MIVTLASVFLMAEVLIMLIGMVAVFHPDRRFLMRWVPTMMFYFPIGSVAAYKALYELVFHPYYLDKTQHGVVAPDTGTG